MPVSDAIGLLLSVGVAGAALLSQAELWQRKEYRLDRLWAHVTEGSQLKNLSLLLTPFFLFVNSGWLAYLGGQSPVAESAGWLALVAIAVYHAQRILRRGLFRPSFTTKVIIILALAVGFSLLHIALTYTAQDLVALQGATLALFQLPYVALAVAIGNVLGAAQKRRVIQAAMRLREQHNALSVVGITGSVGKTSTKHFLEQLMRPEGHVAATAEHRNAEFPVAQDMVRKLTPDLLTYIVEMGAYRRGEIATLARLARPQFGIVTRISNQHLALFGSPKKLAQAKWELVESLPTDGVAILNHDDETIRNQAKNLEAKTMWYSATQAADVWAENPTYTPTTIRCQLHIGDASQAIEIPLASEAALSSCVAAAAAALALGVLPTDIFARLEKVTPIPRTMAILAGPKQSTVIDDSYSASEDSVRNALHHLQRLKQTDKRIVLMPIIELGKESRSVHKRIGRELQKLDQATIYITDAAHQKELELADAGVVIEPDARRLASQLAENLSADSVVLLEGRVPDIVRQHLGLAQE